MQPTLMAPLSWHVLATAFVAEVAFTLILEQIKRPVMAVFKVA
jgi:hypothetical protein